MDQGDDRPALHELAQAGNEEAANRREDVAGGGATFHSISPFASAGQNSPRRAPKVIRHFALERCYKFAARTEEASGTPHVTEQDSLRRFDVQVLDLFVQRVSVDA